MVVPAYAASTVSKFDSRVLNTAVPVSGAVHEYQTERSGMLPWIRLARLAGRAGGVGEVLAGRAAERRRGREVVGRGRVLRVLEREGAVRREVAVDGDPVGRAGRGGERRLGLQHAVEVVIGSDGRQRSQGASGEDVEGRVERRITRVERRRPVLGSGPAVPDRRVGRAARDARLAGLTRRVGVVAEHRSVRAGDGRYRRSCRSRGGPRSC